MKCRIIITDGVEEIVIYTKEENALTKKIEALAKESTTLIGIRQEEWERINPLDVELFVIKGGKLYAVTDSGEYRLKERLSAIEDSLGDNFVRINQSCIARLDVIQRFKASVGGSLCVVFKNGYSEYVSRRQLSTVKRAVGIRKSPKERNI